MQTINEDIKNGTFKPVYLLYGEEAFLKQSYKKKLRAAISGDDTMNYNYFEGKGLDVNELISLADTMPFFSERRLILIEDSGFFKSSCEDLAEYLTQVAPATHFIFVEEEVDKRSKMYKTVKNNGSHCGDEAAGQRAARQMGGDDPGAEWAEDHALHDESLFGARRR